MKKGALLHAQISQTVAQLGHTDSIAIADAGLPIPAVAQRIDLALTNGVPTFLQVLQTVGQEMQIEQVILAEEIKTANPTVHQQILTYLTQLATKQGNTILPRYISHAAFKQQTQQCKAVIRSGECTPYANIILLAGVTF